MTVPALPDRQSATNPARLPALADPTGPPVRRSAGPVAKAAATAARAAGGGGLVAGAVAAWQAGVPWWAAAGGLAGTAATSRVSAKRAAQAGRLRLDESDPLAAIRAQAEKAGGGAFIGLDHGRGGIVHAPAESAVLVLGPPRRGKSTSVVIPSVLTAPGAVVSTSTKPDVLMATAPARSRYGTVWAFDPTGQADLPDGVRRLRWSPLDAAGDWGAAKRIAAAMVGASPAAKGTRHESHWTSRASALLGPLLYAAASVRMETRDVVGWVLSGDVDTANMILEHVADRGDADADLACMVLGGVQRAADQERQSIWSATADVIDVYTTGQALDSCERSNWEPHQFTASADTVYVAAPAEHQAAVAPLVVALIEAVRDAQYQRHRAAELAGIPAGKPVTLALDEVANIAPIASLPALVSEAGGQGLHTIAAVQDLSQVRGRWGSDIADGFLSLFQHLVVLPGIRDTKTLEALSVICGEWDRPQTSTTRTRTKSREPFKVRSQSISLAQTTNFSTTRQRQLPPGEIYGMPDGQALYLSGSGWRHITLAPHYTHPRWQTALASAPGRIVVWGHPDTHQQPAHTQEQAQARAAHPARAGRALHHRHDRHQASQPGPGDLAGAGGQGGREHTDQAGSGHERRPGGPAPDGLDGAAAPQPDRRSDDGRGLSAGREGAAQ
ncbi:MAG: TraM recognition domain-containing protein [Micromonosporaceae bacterium]|nr:TraM recognition domain-containing protein [Micromonosporaceae bacterium]